MGREERVESLDLGHTPVAGPRQSLGQRFLSNDVAGMLTDDLAGDCASPGADCRAVHIATRL